MAITTADVQTWADLAARNLIPPNPRLLEIGEANWYGDVKPDPRDIGGESTLKRPGFPDGYTGFNSPFAVARSFYRRILNPSAWVAVDLNGTPQALRIDLNQPLVLPEHLPQQFDVIINTGTGEHIFDQCQFFRTIHERCAVGGIMFHAAPWLGWINHGFYCLQPVLFIDLAAANEYETVRKTIWEHDGSTTLYVVLRKTVDKPFCVPMQGRGKG